MAAKACQGEAHQGARLFYLKPSDLSFKLELGMIADDDGIVSQIDEMFYMTFITCLWVLQSKAKSLPRSNAV